MAQQQTQDSKSVMKNYRKQTSSYPLIGHLVYWSISEFQISFAEFVSRMQKAGIPETLAKQTSEKSAANRAVKEFAKNKTGKFHRKLADGQDRAAFAVVTQEVNSTTLDAAFQTETKAILDKNNKTFKVEGPGGEEIEKSFESYKESYSADQFRNVVLKYLPEHCASISIRDRGGVYFVPIQKADELACLEEFFKLFPETSLEIVPVIDMDESKRSMWKALVGEIQYEMGVLKKDISELAPDVSDKVLERRLEDYNQLSGKVAMYEDLLQGTAKGLKESLNDISVTIRDMLSKKR